MQLTGSCNSAHDIVRYGGLSLGESRDLVNDIMFNPVLDDQMGSWLLPDETGKFPLPVWVDHVGSKGTVWKQFSTEREKIEIPSEKDLRWITILN